MRITGKVEIYGVIGYPIKHSLSPLFQNAAFFWTGIEALYVPFEVSPENLKKALEGLRASGVKGLNVTIPHKEAVLSFADVISPEAKEIGAVNTLKFTRTSVEAYNTDWIGFLKAIQELEDPKGKTVLVLGAGGAAKAVIYSLKKVKAQVLVWNRTPEKIFPLEEKFGVEKIKRPEEALPVADIIVNTTSVGLKEEDPPLFDYSLLEEKHIVVDLIYKDTPLLKEAKKKSCRVQNGFPMLLYQGAESFRIWTGCNPPLEIMKLALKGEFPTGYSRIP